MTLKINGATGGSVSIDAPDNTSPAGTDVTLTLPTSAGSSGQYLQTNGSGTLSWQTVEGLPDAIDVNASAPADSVNIDAGGRLLVGTSTSRAAFAGNYNSQIQAEGSGSGAGRGSLSVINNAVGDHPSFIVIGKSNTNTIGGTTLVSANQWLGVIDFQGTDGSTLRQAASIGCYVDGTPGTNDMPGRLVFSTTADGASSPTERMRIKNDGRAVIGGSFTTSYGQVFTAVKADDGGMYFGIGDQGNSANAWSRVSGTTTYTHIQFANPNGSIGSITTNGASTAYNTSSDYRLKENVVDLDGAITRVKQLAPKRFNFISDETDTLVDGFLAHEAQVVVPEAVTGTHNEVDDDGNAVMQGIDQSKLVPLLTAALQEAISKIETLETANASQAATIAAFEARLTALEGGAA